MAGLHSQLQLHIALIRAQRDFAATLARKCDAQSYICIATYLSIYVPCKMFRIKLNVSFQFWQQFNVSLRIVHEINVSISIKFDYFKGYVQGLESNDFSASVRSNQTVIKTGL